MSAETWSWCRGFYKVYVDDYKIKEKINGWKDSQLHCHYYHSDGKKAWDFIIPSKYYNKVAELLGFPPRLKNQNRVKSGKEVGNFNLCPAMAKVKSSNLPVEAFKNEDPYQAMASSGK